MKFPLLNIMPASSIREWLDRQLELRGIDAVIYTRYILSILQQDSYNLEPQERDLFPIASKKKQETFANKAKGKNKQKMNKVKSADCEEMKKSAAVECLLSVSEQECGIEELVDELCSRLKTIKCEGYTTQDDAKTVSTEESELSFDINSSSAASPEEQAEKYYAAFPALSGNSDSDGASTTSNTNSVWDGKKVLGTSAENRMEDSAKLMVFSVSTAPDVDSQDADAKPADLGMPTADKSDHIVVKGANELKSSRRGSKLVYHHHHHHHHHHHGAKLLKNGKEQGGGKPSFIVPKCKYRILKQRVPFFKGRSPFSISEARSKREHPKCNAGADRFHCKKLDDKDGIAYDSSFEDGEETSSVAVNAVKCSRTAKSGNKAGGRFSGQHQNRNKADFRSSSTTRSDGGCSESDVADGPIGSMEDSEIFQQLQAKFNESLASIWSEREIIETPIDKLSRMLETAFKTSLSTWFTNLKKPDDDPCPHRPIYGSLIEETAEMPSSDIGSVDIGLVVDKGFTDGVLIRQPFLTEDQHQRSLKDMGNLWNCQQSTKTCDGVDNKDEQCGNRIWQCENEKHNFIKGGVYGFARQEEPTHIQDEMLSLSNASDIFDVRLDGFHVNSPAFDSDVDTLLGDGKGSSCEAIREEDLKLIWEVLGAMGGTYDGETSISSGDELNEDAIRDTDRPHHIANSTDPETNSIWERLNHLDLWENKESSSAFKAEYPATFHQHVNIADQSGPSFKGLSRLWTGSNSAASHMLSADLHKCLTSSVSAFRWETSNPYDHRDLWSEVRKNEELVTAQLSDGDYNDNDGDNIFGDDHLHMTRSYDSYLNREVDEEDTNLDGVCKLSDLAHHSDPILFGKKCTLTYHKGESLFVEVKPQRCYKQNRNLSPVVDKSLITDPVPGSASANTPTKRGEEHPEELNKASPAYIAAANDEACEEENLLTSSKTHFRPIRQHSYESDDTVTSNAGDRGVAVPENADLLSANTNNGGAAEAVPQYEEDTSISGSLEDKPIFTLDENGLLHLRSESTEGQSSSDLYMVYKGQETTRKTSKEVATTAFVPKFKLMSSNLEKFCQTEDIEEAEKIRERAVGFAHESRHSRCKSYQQDSEHCREDAEFLDLIRVSTAFKHLDSKWESMNREVSALSPYDLVTYGIQTRLIDLETSHEIQGPMRFRNSKYDILAGTRAVWSTADEEDEDDIDDGDEQNVDCCANEGGTIIRINATSNWGEVGASKYRAIRRCLDERDLWAVSDDGPENEECEELKNMKEELKKEEEELFDDINQMRELDLSNDWDDGSDYSSGLLHNMDDEQHKATLEWPPSSSTNSDIYQEITLDSHEDEDCPELEMINGGNWSENIDDQANKGSTKKQSEGNTSPSMDYKLFDVQDASDTTHQFPVIPSSKVIYSSDLEEEWMKHGKPFYIQVPKRNHSKIKLRTQRRPCTFYMDGNCRRTDCRYSHDLASITCRFWEEGTCFKGITCPFLHGYPRNSSPRQANNKDKDFQLQSESEFPSLSKSVDSTSSGSWIASALATSKRKKKRNRPRHHSSSFVDEDVGKCKSGDSDELL